MTVKNRSLVVIFGWQRKERLERSCQHALSSRVEEVSQCSQAPLLFRREIRHQDWGFMMLDIHSLF